MIKKIFIFIISISLSLQSILAQTSVPCESKAQNPESILRLCNNVEDIICKDVKKEERRSCDGKEDTIFNSKTTTTDLYQFFKKCLGASVTSFTQFFVDFIPELLKGIWNVAAETGKLVKNSVTGEGTGLGAKMFGFYESVLSVASDIYEAAKEDPVAIVKNLWDQITNAAGPLVAGYDCLKPEVKVEKICGFVSGWVIPPLMLAKILVKGVAFAPTIMKGFNVSSEAIEKMRSALKFSEKRPKKTLKEYLQLFEEYKKLGYTKDEIEFLYKTGKLDKLKLEDLAATSTQIGKKQREIILELKGKNDLPNKTAQTKKTNDTTPTSSYKAPVKLDLKTDYVQLEVMINGKLTPVNGHIFETSILDSGVNHYRIQYLDPSKNKFRIINMSPEKMKKANVIDSEESLRKISERAKTDKSFIDPMEEFKRLQAEANRQDLVIPDDPKSLDFVTPNKTKYEGGIDYQRVEGSEKLTITKGPEIKTAPKLKPPKDNEMVIPSMRSNYIKLLDHNSMGYVTYMPAQLIGVVKERNIDKYLLRVYDTTTNSFVQKSFTKRQLELMKAQTDTASEKLIKEKSKNGQIID